MLPIFVGNAANLVSTPYVVTSLGLGNFGLWALTGTLAQYAVLLDLGVSRAVMRHVALYSARKDEASERSVIGGSLIFALAIGCFLLLFPILMPNQLSSLIGADDPALTRTLFFSAIAVLISGLIGSILMAASVGRGRTVAANIGVALQRFSVVVGGVVALLVKPTLGFFAVGSGIGGVFGLCAVVIAIYIDEREVKAGWPRANTMRTLISFGLKGQTLSVAEIAMFQSAKLLAGLMIGPAAAGAYELGSRLALGARSIATAASAVISAHLTRLFAAESGCGVWDEYPKLVQKNAAVCNFPLFLVAATAISAVPAWLGVQRVEVVWIVVGLSLACTFNVATAVSTAAMFAINRLGIVVTIVSIGSAFSIAIELILGLGAGFYGILVGMATSIMLSSCAAVVYIHWRNQISLRILINSLKGPFAIGWISTFVAMPVGLFFDPTDRTSALTPFLSTLLIFLFLYLIPGWKFGYLPKITRISGA
jgi:O-antigen/teichoic acid export membrane protein